MSSIIYVREKKHAAGTYPTAHRNEITLSHLKGREWKCPYASNKLGEEEGKKKKKGRGKHVDYTLLFPIVPAPHGNQIKSRALIEQPLQRMLRYERKVEDDGLEEGQARHARCIEHIQPRPRRDRL